MHHDDEKPNASLQGSPLAGPNNCLRWEAALVDLLDGILPAEEESAFRAHAVDCTACQALLAECGHGREWARLLHDTPPAVPEALLGQILIRTLGGTQTISPPGEAGFPGAPGVLLPSGDMLILPTAPVWSLRSQKQARVLMTAAMAFFSILLTLSISGVRPGDLRAALQAPAALEATATRQFFDTKKQVVSFYDNLRLVREVEATVDDLRQNNSRDSHGRRDHPQPSANSLPAFPFAAVPLLASREADNKADTLSVLRAEERNML